MRREIIMIGSIIEFILIFILFILNIILVTVFSVIYSVVKGIEDGASDLKGVIRDPIGSFSKIPKSIKDDVNTIKDYVKKTSKQIGRTKKLSR
jgi:phage-related protein